MNELPPNSTRITFHGAAGSVTGSNFLIETSGLRILVDCGLFQGDHDTAQKNYADFPYDPTTIDLIIVTHAHIDHIGRLPKLVAAGFSGPIYCTTPTADLVPFMLEDSQSVLAEHAKRNDRDPLYTAADVKATLRLIKPVSYHNEIPLTSQVSATLYDAGHVLGSAMVVFGINQTRILFTGDLGNSPSPILRDTEVPEGVHYVITESVYGDRNHEDRDARVEKLERAVEDIHNRRGTLLVPVFSLERTQEILFELNNLIEQNRLPKIPVFLDSPLAIKLTDVYRKHANLLNESVKDTMEHDQDIFGFPGLRLTEFVEESKRINTAPSPKVILAGSGMSAGGRILHHELRYLEDPNNMVLFVGFQGAGTIGRQLREGARRIKIYGHSIQVKAEIREISGFSGHKDSNHLQEFIHNLGNDVREVWCVMGEPTSAQFLAQRLRDYQGVRASAPRQGEQIIISTA